MKEAKTVELSSVIATFQDFNKQQAATQKKLEALSKRSFKLQEMALDLHKDVMALVDPQTPAPAARKPRVAKLDEGIVDILLRAIYIAHRSGPVNKTAIEIQSDVKGRQLGNYLVKLVALGKIIQEGKGKAATYRLVAPEPDVRPTELRDGAAEEK